MKAGIVGAGIMGRLLAFSLARAKWKVTLFDFKQGENCSDTAAGMLAPLAELEKSEMPIFKLGMEALEQHWPAILALLKPRVFFQKKGSVLLAHSREQRELAPYIQRIGGKLKTLSFCQKLSPAELNQLEPALSTFQQGYFFPAEGQIDSQGVLTALEENLKEQGVFYQDKHFVEKLSPGRVSLQGKTQRFDWVFDCRGLGAKAVFPLLRGLRGELIWLDAPRLSLSRPIRLLHPRYSLYLLPRPEGRFLLGATEIEATDYSPLSVRSALELLTAAYSLHSQFAEARILKMSTHCRPALPDHLPEIQYSEGLLAINGLYRHGFLIAPSLADEVSRWLESGFSQLRYPELWKKAA